MRGDFVAHLPNPLNSGFTFCGCPLWNCVTARHMSVMDCKDCRRNVGNLRITTPYDPWFGLRMITCLIILIGELE